MVQLGRLGVWAWTDLMTAAEAADFARELEALGYPMLWIPEAFGREALTHAAWLLAGTETLTVATGIANIYARDPVAARCAQMGLNEQSGGRFVLGLGVSHRPLVQGVRGHDYARPVATMRAYLEGMRAVDYPPPHPAQAPLTVIAALGPRMLELAAELADGAHPYMVTPDHTAQARQILGPDRLLCPEQKVLLETDPVKARGLAREAIGIYLSLENYTNNLKRLGFGDEDFAGGGSDRLVDAMVAWGDETAIRARLQQHWDAGADHVCVQTLHPSGQRLPDRRLLELLAPGQN